MNNSQIRVLVVFANPRGTDPLRLGEEERAIKESIKLSRSRDNILLTTCHASTVHDLRRNLLEQNFEIIHISGHGANTGLVLENESGCPYFVPQQALAELFQVYSPPVQCVILNACFSLSQGQLTSLSVPFTIAMEGSISDKAAIEFSRGFYDAIGAGRDIEFAYEEGCRAVKLSAPGTQFISRLMKNTSKFQDQAKPAIPNKQRVNNIVSLQEIDREILINLNETEVSNFDVVKSQLTLSRTKRGCMHSMPTDNDIKNSLHLLLNKVNLIDIEHSKFYKINDQGRDWLLENR